MHRPEQEGMTAAERNQLLAEFGIEACCAGNWTWWQLTAKERVFLLGYLDSVYVLQLDAGWHVPEEAGVDEDGMNYIEALERRRELQEDADEWDGYVPDAPDPPGWRELEARLDAEDDAYFDCLYSRSEGASYRDCGSQYAESMGGMSSSWSEDR